MSQLVDASIMARYIRKIIYLSAMIKYPIKQKEWQVTLNNEYRIET